MTLPAVLSFRNLKKAYNGNPAVKGINLEIRKGTCFGLLGSNGAGKTTAIEIMEDILAPDKGEILYKEKPRTRQFRHDIGIQFQQPQLMDYICVEETLSTVSAFYRRSLPLNKVISMCHLDEVKKKMNDRISGGQRQRLLLGLALINDPELVFLDPVRPKAADPETF